MPIRLFVAGERPSAGDFNRYFLQQHVALKNSNESVTSSTVLQDDNELTAPVIASALYWVWGIIFYTGPGGTTDLLMDWDGPTGTTFDWLSDSLGSGATASVSTVSRNLQSITSNPSPGTISGVNTVTFTKGILTVGGTSGNFRLQWAQSTSSATPVTILADSCLILRRLTT